MSNRIKILPENISNKIAAGEVVERPASVVKELVENSIDAQAAIIDIYIEDGGKRLIKVIDNGVGMSADDALLSIEPHATSKISSIDDISKITTMGFRGEALPSIASVSKFTLKTRNADTLEGYEIDIHGGKFIKGKSVGAPIGTEVIVKNLFFNIPARKKFMKSTITEERAINEVITKLAIANKEISFNLTINKKKTLSLPSNNKLIERISEIYGKSIYHKLIKFSGNSTTINIYGYISKPEYAKNSRRYQYIFVNKRATKNELLYKTVLEAYKIFVSERFYPILFLFIDIDPTLVDINVHPTKQEVKFRNRRLIQELLYDSIHKSLKNNLTIRSSYKEKEKAIFPLDNILKEAKVNYISTGNSKSSDQEYLDFGNNNFEHGNIENHIDEETISDKMPLSILNNKITKIICILNDTYILCLLEDGFIIIDQHAAHERVLFEKLLYSDRKTISQKLLLPITLELPFYDYKLLKKHKKDFFDVGFEFDEFGKNTIVITGVPIIYSDKEVEKNIFKILEAIEEEISSKKETITREIIAKFACKMAVKANDRLNKEESIGLIKQLSICRNPSSCPHGRPTVIKITYQELEKRFGRR